MRSDRTEPSQTRRDRTGCNLAQPNPTQLNLIPLNLTRPNPIHWEVRECRPEDGAVYKKIMMMVMIEMMIIIIKVMIN